jgi:murein DD-endopeptidase MepM/ murein hydrolase activator NlpD
MKKAILILFVLISLTVFAQDARQVSMGLPLSSMGTITQSYGDSTNIRTGEPWFHNGIDISIRMRTPVISAMAGLVSEVGNDTSYGNYVIVEHDNKYKTFYAQLDEITVKKGQRVAQGETIALSGNTGLSTGPHLHFSVYYDGKTINPLSVFK